MSGNLAVSGNFTVVMEVRGNWQKTGVNFRGKSCREKLFIVNFKSRATSLSIRLLIAVF